MGARIRYIVTETLLWVAAAAGLLAMALVAAAYLFNISLIMFRTGSMEPTIPTGAVAVVQEVPASGIEVGDVLTIDRPGQLPVTHRVTSVEPGESAAERVITMRGDANDSDDPAPYAITEAREVLWSVPGLANVVNQMGSPYVLGGVTLAASLLVGWAFWPAKPRAGSPSERSARPASSRVDRHSPRRRRRTHASSGTLLVFLATASAGALMTAPDAAAASHREAGVVRESASSDFVSLRSAYLPAQRLNMAPGDAARWDIDVSLNPPEAARARTGLSMNGEFPLNVTISACDQRWVDGPASSAAPQNSCPGELTTLLDGHALEPSGAVHWLDRFSSAQDLWLRVDTVLPFDAAVSADASAIVRVHAEVAGDHVAVSPGSDSLSERGVEADSTSPHGHEMERGNKPPALAQTGGNFLWLLALALALITIGRVLHKHRAPDAPAGEGA